MIRVENLRKRYEGSATDVLRGVSFNVGRGEVYTLLGPSGCGKTTSLRSVAGLEIPDEGAIRLGERVVFSARERVNIPPDRRDIGMVFQSYAIWPHMTVAENVAYPLWPLKLSTAEIKRRTTSALEVVGLAGLADRPAPNLSGGQQQRVALARAIVAEPKLLLFDEPLSNLDAKLREQMRRELSDLQRRLGHTVVYVTHDQEEALALSTRIGLMRAGEILEETTPAEMYQRPRHPFTASFLGAANFVDCTLTGTPKDGEMVEVETELGRFSAVARKGESLRASLFFRPHNARLVERAPDLESEEIGSALVTGTLFQGENVDVFAQRGQTSIHLRVRHGPIPQVGEEIRFSLDPEFNIVFVPTIAMPPTNRT